MPNCKNCLWDLSKLQKLFLGFQFFVTLRGFIFVIFYRTNFCYFLWTKISHDHHITILRRPID